MRLLQKHNNIIATKRKEIEFEGHLKVWCHRLSKNKGVGDQEVSASKR